MTTTSWIAFAIFGVSALVNWFAVFRQNRVLEIVAKPLTLTALIAATVALSVCDETAQKWMVVALVFSLAGDVFLLWAEKLFIPGLLSFLCGHIAFIVALANLGVSVPLLLAGVAIVVVLIATLGRVIVTGAREGAEPELAIPVLVYMLVISTMVVMAIGTGNPVAIAGAVLFYLSDTLIGWTRFKNDFTYGHLGVMVTYHLGQLGLVLALLVH